MWGSIANVIGVEGALLISGAALVASPCSVWTRMPTVSGPNELSVDVLADPGVRLSLTPRSGPIEIEIEYRVDPAKARLFYAVMQHVQLSRQRNGAYGWSMARDIADPQLWTERYHCPTWHDYLRQRSRSAASERGLHLRANEFHMGPEPIRIRRMLERPIGSVRWKENTPDRSTGDVAPIRRSACATSGRLELRPLPEIPCAVDALALALKRGKLISQDGRSRRPLLG
jgi:hypothetical protein